MLIIISPINQLIRLIILAFIKYYFYSLFIENFYNFVKRKIKIKKLKQSVKNFRTHRFLISKNEGFIEFNKLLILIKLIRNIGKLLLKLIKIYYNINFCTMSIEISLIFSNSINFRISNIISINCKKLVINQNCNKVTIYFALFTLLLKENSCYT